MASHNITILEYPDQDSVYADLVNGRLDGTLVLGAAVQLGFLSKPQGAKFEMVSERIDDPSILGAASAIGVRKGDAGTLKLLDAALKQIRQDGTLDQLTRKYLGAGAAVQ